MTDERKLFHYQAAGAMFLARRKYAYLADDMGMGKTIQAIAAADKAKLANVLVICPATACINWSREILTWQQVPRAVTLYETPRRTPALYGVLVVSWERAIRPENLAHLRSQPWDAIIFDEAHRLKSPDAHRTQLLIGQDGLARKAARVWFLSGTPVPNHPGELWTVLRVFHSKALTQPDGSVLGYEGFLEKFCITRPSPYGLKVVGMRKSSNLRDLLRDFMIRRDADVADLPPLLMSDVAVEAGTLPAEVLKLEAGKVGQTIKDLVDSNAFEAIAPDAGQSTWAKAVGVLKAPAIVNLVNDWMNDGLEKLIIFAWHRDVIEILRAALKQHGVVVIDGSTPERRRQDAIDQFQTNDRVKIFIGQHQAAGEAITLTAANHVLMAEWAWTPKDIAQPIKRAHRIGQSKTVFVRFAKLAGSLDDAFTSAIRRKTQMFIDLFNPNQETH